MHTHTLVAVYRDRTGAEAVRRDLVGSGIADHDVAISENQKLPRHEDNGGFWDWLFGTDVPDTDRTWYKSSLDEGRTAVSVRVPAEEDIARVETILNDHSPISMEEEGATYQPSDTSEWSPETGGLPTEARAEQEIAAEQAGETRIRTTMAKPESREHTRLIRVYAVERSDPPA